MFWLQANAIAQTPDNREVSEVIAAIANDVTLRLAQLLHRIVYTKPYTQTDTNTKQYRIYVYVYFKKKKQHNIHYGFCLILWVCACVCSDWGSAAASGNAYTKRIHTRACVSYMVTSGTNWIRERDLSRSATSSSVRKRGATIFAWPPNCIQ